VDVTDSLLVDNDRHGVRQRKWRPACRNVERNVGYIFGRKANELAVRNVSVHTGAFPAGCVIVIHADDFWRVGGLNERYLYGSVDSEFYARAVLCGLRYKPIPQGLVSHVKHPSRASTIHKLFRVLRDRATFVAAYFRHYPVEVLKHDYLYRLMRGQLRTALLNLLFFPYTLVANKLGEWWRVMGEDPYDY